MTTDLIALGWDDRRRWAYARHDRFDCCAGRAVRVDPGVCTVLTARGTVRASLSGALLVAAAADPLALPCAGDWLVLRSWPDQRVTVEAVLPRRTAIVRPAGGVAGFGRALAANVDAVAVVEPIDPGPDPARVERLLHLAWQSGAPPLVVLTMADRVADPAGAARRLRAGTAGVAVAATSARTGQGLEPLRQLVTAGRTLALLGAAGCGASTLIEALAGVRPVDDHVLVVVAGGGAVLRVPGVAALAPSGPDVGVTPPGDAAMRSTGSATGAFRAQRSTGSATGAFRAQRRNGSRLPSPQPGRPRRIVVPRG